MPDRVAFNHVGQCVTDLERSKRFYVELLEFTEAREIHPPDELSARLLQLSPPLGMTASYLERDGFVLELIHYAKPTASGERAPRAMNRLGLSHLSMRVVGADAVAARLVALGGRVLEQTRIENPELDASAVFVLDPDGTRIELFDSDRAIA